MKAQQGTVR